MNKRITLGRTSLAPLLALTLLLQSCGGGLLTTFRLALASSAPLVNSLVATGVLKQSQAGPIIADFTDGAQAGLTLERELKGCGADRACKLDAAQKAEQGFRAIVSRHHFAANARIQQIADIADGILSSLVIFYGGGGANATVTAAPLTDTQIEQRLKPEVERLRQLMKP